MFDFLKRRRRDARTSPLTEAERAVVTSNVPCAASLGPEDRCELAATTNEFWVDEALRQKPS
jgi:hypothetical protein